MHRVPDLEPSLGLSLLRAVSRAFFEEKRTAKTFELIYNYRAYSTESIRTLCALAFLSSSGGRHGLHLLNMRYFRLCSWFQVDFALMVKWEWRWFEL